MKKMLFLFAVFMAINSTALTDNLAAGDSDTIKSIINRIIVHANSSRHEDANILIIKLLSDYPLSRVSANDPREITDIILELRLIENSINDLQGSVYYDSLKNYTASINNLNAVEPKPESIAENKTEQTLQSDQNPAEPDNTMFYLSIAAFIILFLLTLYSLYRIFRLKNELYDYKTYIRDKLDGSRSFGQDGNIYKSKFENLEKDIRSLQDNLNGFAEKINIRNNDLNEKISDVTANINAIKEMASGYRKSVADSKSAVTEEIAKFNEGKKKNNHEVVRVEFFQDMGKEQFRKTSSSTPFYIKRFTGRSELYIDDDYEISPYYIEQIKNCFELKGTGKRLFKVKKPAQCIFNENSNSWILKIKGELES